MKKVLNVFGVFFSIILTIVLAALITCYAIVLNVKTLVSKNGIRRVLNNVDVVKILKEADDGKVWDDTVEFAKEIDLTEDQIAEMLNSKKLKGEVAIYINKGLVAFTGNERMKITEKELKNLVVVAIDEYNKVSDRKISDTEKNEILNSINSTVVASVNDSFLHTTEVDAEELAYLRFIGNVLFGSYSVILLFILIIVMALIALFRVSYYKWMSYTAISGILSSFILMASAIGLSIVSADKGNALFSLFKNVIISNIYITAVILIVLAIALFVLHHFLKKMHKADTEVETQLSTL